MVDDPVLTCGALSARLATAEPRFYAVLAGHLEETGRAGEVRVVCTDGTSLIARPHPDARIVVTGTPGLFHVRASRGPTVIVGGCRRCDKLPSRHDVPTSYVAQWILRSIVMAIGAGGVFLFVAGWRRRPFDPLDDLTHGRAPRQALALARPSNERVRIGGTVHDARVLGVEAGKLGPSSATRSCLVLPGANATYREGVGELAYVVGPAKVSTLRVRAGQRAPIAEGDRIELPGIAAFRVELGVPGLLARFFYGDAEHARFVGRVQNTIGTRLHTVLTRALGVASIVVALLDIPYALVLGGALLAGAVGLALTFPRQSAALRETRIRYRDLNELSISELAGGLCISYRGRSIAWLPAPREGELASTVERELRALTSAAQASIRERAGVSAAHTPSGEARGALRDANEAD
jgi:hypothetical protein